MDYSNPSEWSASGLSRTQDSQLVDSKPGAQHYLLMRKIRARFGRCHETVNKSTERTVSSFSDPFVRAEVDKLLF
ncbi:hypothetical protein BKA81DRAFT_365082 [Phyllosticta paracitricarpa]